MEIINYYKHLVLNWYYKLTSLPVEPKEPEEVSWLPKDFIPENQRN